MKYCTFAPQTISRERKEPKRFRNVSKQPQMMRTARNEGCQAHTNRGVGIGGVQQSGRVRGCTRDVSCSH